MSKKNRKTLILIILAGVLSLLAAELVFYFVLGSRGANENTSEPVAVSQETPSPSPVIPSTSSQSSDTNEETDEITLAALGDIVPQMGIVNTGRTADGSLDYSFLFKGDIENILNKSDIKIIGMETVMAGNELGFSGYPRYNSPTEMADAIAGAGFNAVLCASNHAQDMGLEGLQNSLIYWNSNYPDVRICGTHYLYDESTQRADKLPIIDIKGKRIAVLNYSYSENEEDASSDMYGRVDYLCETDPETGKQNKSKLSPDVIEDIKAAASISDAVIVCPHWDMAYTGKVSDCQREWAHEMCDAGADVIIGINPQGALPAEEIESSDGGHKTMCFYSIGDYVSTKNDGNTILEGAVYITWSITDDGLKINKRKSGVFPLVCHYTSDPTRMGSVFFLENYTQDLADSHGINSFGISLSLDKLKLQSDELFSNCSLYTEILGD